MRARYREPWRHYHTLQHIEAIQRWLDRYRSLALRVDELDAAIWFHDAVYDPRRHDNEERSAELMRTRLTAVGFEAGFAERVAALVLATKSHLAAAGDGDQALLLDLDLSILGRAPEIYDAYARQVRLEYAHVPDEAFRIGRTQVLAHFLRQPRLFVREELAALWEEPARRNLLREQAALARPGVRCQSGPSHERSLSRAGDAQPAGPWPPSPSD